MDPLKVLANMQKAAKDSLCYFSNRNKAQRECWVISEFLKRLNISFDDSELISPPLQSKIDVTFRDANFQVKEIIDPGVLRNREAKERYRAFKDAASLDDIKIPPSHGRDVPRIARMYDLVLNESDKLSCSPKYKGIAQSLDLIFYVSRSRAAIIRVDEVGVDIFKNFGWRSVSCINSKQGIVLYASNTAPAFIRCNAITSQ